MDWTFWNFTYCPGRFFHHNTTKSKQNKAINASAGKSGFAFGRGALGHVFSLAYCVYSGTRHARRVDLLQLHIDGTQTVVPPWLSPRLEFAKESERWSNRRMLDLRRRGVGVATEQWRPACRHGEQWELQR